MAKGATRWDVELVRAQTRGQALLIATSRGAWVLCIAATALPIWMMQGVIEPLAGKTTSIEANLPITLVMSASIVFNIAQAAINFVRRKSFRELRGQKDALEDKLGLEAGVEIQASASTT
jgi:hypothetical protein